jgi:hypothetical protein
MAIAGQPRRICTPASSNREDRSRGIEECYGLRLVIREIPDGAAATADA